MSEDPSDPTRERWERVKELLQQGMKLPPEQRTRFLAEACGWDALLREELQSLLAASADVGTGFLQTPPTGNATLDSQIAGAAGLTAGQMFAQRYLLIRQLGEGGMGQVWLAEQTSPVRRQVALKLIRAGWYDEAIVQRFLSERQSLAIMDHPAIAKVFDAGATPQGQPYLVMEFVPGLPITEYCDQCKLGIRERLELFIKACEGVQHAHQKAIIHRDLKPANILVLEVDGTPRPRIIDFGLAKATTPRVADETLLTRHGHIFGTPGYISPEQVDPTVEDIDTRTDVYSLGVVLYVLLTGLLPFETKQREKPPLYELLRKLREEEPPTPSIKVSSDRETSSVNAAARGTHPTQLASLLRGDLDWIAMKALERDRARRYGTPSELAADLKRYLNHEPVVARPASALYRLRKYARRHRVAAGVGLGLMILLGAFAALQSMELRRTLHERDRANRERDRALSLAARNEAVSEFLNLLISEAAQSDKPVTVTAMLERSEALVASEIRGNAEHEAAVLDMLASQHQMIGEFGRAEPQLLRALDLTRNSPDLAMRAKLTCDHALNQAYLGNPAEAKRALHAVIDSHEAAPTDDADCLEDLSSIAQDEPDARAALSLSLQALERLRQAPRVSPGIEASFIGSVGYSLSLNHRMREADQYFADSLRRLKELNREGGPDANATRNNWGAASAAAGDLRLALELYDRTLKLITDADPDGRPAPELALNRGKALLAMGRYAEAQAASEYCVSRAEQAGQADTEAYCLVNLALDAREMNQLAAAQGYIDKAGKLIDMTPTLRSGGAMTRPIAAGRIALSRHQLAAARSAFDAAIAGSGQTVLSIQGLLGRAEVNLDEGKLAEATQDAHAALALAQTWQGGKPYSNHTGLAWLMLARILDKQGDQSAARQAAATAVTHFSQTVDPGLPEAKAAGTLALATTSP